MKSHVERLEDLIQEAEDRKKEINENMLSHIHAYSYVISHISKKLDEYYELHQKIFKLKQEIKTLNNDSTDQSPPPLAYSTRRRSGALPH